MTDFEYMNDAVDALCNSLIEEPEKWLFETHTFRKIGSDLKYWGSSWDSSIVSTWNGSSRDIVFSYEQGQRIRIAYDTARAKQASCAQSKVIKDFQKLVARKTEKLSGNKSWWEFWK